MKKLTILFFLLLLIAGAKANDGVYYANGNQLIPVTETDISVRKEVLTINRVDDRLVVTVYYEFFNPTKPKDLLVGFEAESPYDSYVDMEETFPNHPHISNFTVTINGDRLGYEVAHVLYDEEDYRKRDYFRNGQFSDLSREQCIKTMNEYEGMGYPFYYVYHFNAHFREGLNIVQHTYDFEISNSVGEEYRFTYILTAANRWANHQIDDFTLNIDMGEAQSFFIDPTFFKSVDEWVFKGTGRATPEKISKNTKMFHVQKGAVSFHKDGFHPEGELHISKPRGFYAFGDHDTYDIMDLVKKMMGGLEELKYRVDESTLTAEQRRILRNVPFAYRGHVFKDEGLRQFFESTYWYVPNPEYKDDMNTMTPEERGWIYFMSE
jgi:hypothetical protein